MRVGSPRNALPLLLQHEPGRTVTLEPGGHVVRKTFSGSDVATLEGMARRERDRMDGYAAALTTVVGAGCPRSIELLRCGQDVVLRMERAPGRPLRDELNSTVLDAGRYRDLAVVISGALIAYVRTFDEPYWDFIFRNMFYDPAGGVVSFFDFGVPEIYGPFLGELRRRRPLEVSAGGMVASAVFEAARPRHVMRRLEHRQAPVLAASVVQALTEMAPAGSIGVAATLEVARTTYRAASAGGSPLRRGWYRYPGRGLARPGQKFARVGRIGGSNPGDHY